MPTHLAVDDHLAALVRSGTALAEAAAAAGLDAPVPTCPTWDVRALVTHQGMVHRWAAANLRGDQNHSTEASQAEAAAAPDLLAWYSAGLTALVDTLRSVPEDVQAMVFLNDAPPPRRFWARRQAHETTIHCVDAIAAQHGRSPSASEVDIDASLATDGIDELLCGFITRKRGKLRSAAPYTILVCTDDTGHSWTVRVSDDPVVTTPAGGIEQPDVRFSGTAVGLYLSLWNRSDEMCVTGRADVVEQWRSQVRVRWS